MTLRAIAVLALPFVFLVLPLAAGFRWNAIAPAFVSVPPVPGLETYTGRWPDLPITIEPYGAGVAVIPFRAHLRAYLRAGDLPLWNPYAALGQPLAAQGEGSPYSPFAVLRALLPADWSNAITIGVFLLSALALTRFLRLLGLSDGGGAFGGAVWALSGALTLHIPRDNLADQVAMIPPLFLAATWAIQSRRMGAYAVFGAVAGLHAVAGFLQIGVNALILLAGFLIVLAYLRPPTAGRRTLTAGRAFLFLGLGTALAGPYLLPIVEALGAAHNKNMPLLAFIPMPTANVVAFFLPLLFGPPLRGWLEGGYPDVMDWNNLFAYGSIGLSLLAVFGLAAMGGQRRDQRLYFLFFLGAMLFFLARYVSFPPLAAINVLPILNQQSPKHTNGVAVFCLVVAASFGAEWLRCADGRRVAWLTLGLFGVLVSTVLTIVGRRGPLLSIQPEPALLSIGVTLLLALIVLFGLWRARAARTDADAVFIATAVVVGELAVYLPIGNGDPVVVGARVGMFALVVLASLFAVRRAAVLAGVTGLLALLAYAGVVILPTTGLPNPLDVDTPPPYMAWLRAASADVSRAFGIRPDYAAIAGIQDIEAVGPLATHEYLTFVGLISPPEVATLVSTGSTFSLIQPHAPTPMYDLDAEYPRARPILDWFGVRYLVLDHRIFGTPTDDAPLDVLGALPDLATAYQDEHVTIVESRRAASKAAFAVAARRAASADEAIEPLQANPASIDGAVQVETSDSALKPVATTVDGAAQIPVPLAEYRPNDLRATFEAPAPGVFVVRDSFYPGWTATLDGQPVDVLRVNGMVRGVIVPAAGRHDVVMRYQPFSFTAGLLMGAAAALVLIVMVIRDRTRPDPPAT